MGPRVKLFTDQKVALARIWQSRAWPLHLDRLLPWVVLLCSLVVTYQLWTSARNIARKELQSQFDFRVADAGSHIRLRMLAYEQVLRGARGLFAASHTVERKEFSAYTRMLMLEENYPGMQGISFAQLVPAQRMSEHIVAIAGQGVEEYHIHPYEQREVYAPVCFIEPFSGSNLRVPGYDNYSDPVRRDAMNAARDSGKATITGKLRLIQESGRNCQAGILMFLPVYAGGSVPESPDMRRRQITGWVSAPFRMDDLISSILKDSHDLDIKIYDGETVADQALLFDNDPGTGEHSQPCFQATNKLLIAGHPWVLQIRSLGAFENRVDRRRSQLIAAGGVGISLLLALITWLLVHGRLTAVESARKIRRASQALQEAEKLALIGHFDYDPRSDTTFWSEGLERIWGFEAGAPHRKFGDFLATVHPDDLHIILDSDADKSWHETSSEFRIFRGNGEIRHIYSCGYREFAPGGEVIRVFGIDQDITDRKLAEVALIQSRDYYLQLLETFPALIWRAGTDTKCNYFNQTWLEFTGRSLKEEVGDGWAEGVHPEDLDYCVSTYLDAFRELRSFSMEYRLRHHDGSYRWISDHGRPYYGLAGEFAGYIGSCYDITVQKSAEQAIKDAHDKLEQRITERTAELSAANDQLRKEMVERRQLEKRLLEAQKLEAIGQLAGGVAHEVRNPLNAILSITGALFREKEIAENPELDPYITHIRAQVGRLAKLMNDLLDLGKPIPQSTLHPVPLYELCKETLALWKSSGTAANKRALLVAENEPMGMRVIADSMKLQQVIFNLLENAGQHSHDEKILLSLDEDYANEPAMAIIRVIDGGSGVTAENMTRIFDPFYSNRSGGTGLGLALVKHFMEHMGGAVSMRNNDPHPGCTAELRIPLMTKETRAC